MRNSAMLNRLIFPAACILLGGLLAEAMAGQGSAPRIAGSRTGPSYLGIGVADIDAERAKTLNLREVRGAEVKSVEPDSPAANAGLKPGDVVLEYNGQRIEGMEQLIRMVRETPSGREAALLIARGGATQTVTAMIGSRRGRRIADIRIDVPDPPEPPLLPEMPQGLMTWRSSLGIETETLGPQLAGFFGVKEGVLVRSVSRDSAAEKAGILAGDVIVRVDGTGVATSREVTSAIRAARSKKTFPVIVVRNRKETTLTLTLEEGGGGRGPERIAFSADHS
jgi:serine protease Do